MVDARHGVLLLRWRRFVAAVLGVGVLQVHFGDTRFETFLLLARIEYMTGPAETYVLPLICTQEPTAGSAETLLKVHSSARGSDLYLRNALTDEEFLHRLLEMIEQKARFRGLEGEIHAARTDAFLVLCGPSGHVPPISGVNPTNEDIR